MSDDKGPRPTKHDADDQGSAQRSPKGEDSGGPRGPGGGKNPNFMSRGALGWILLGGLAIALLLMMNHHSHSAKEVSWKQFKTHAEQDEILLDPQHEIVMDDRRITATLVHPLQGFPDRGLETENKVFVSINPKIQPLMIHDLDQLELPYRIKASRDFLWNMLFSWGPILLILFLIYFFVFRSLRNAGGGPGMLGNFGRSRHKVLTKEHSSITLDNVAGIDEAKDEVAEIIEFLKNPKKFQRLGGRVPRGVLLIGPPGCGKTLLAKAVAGEADVPFFSISGSDFVEMFVGVGASRVRDLFKQAKESSPCIIFLDEIDAVGRRRGSGFSSGGHDEREQTLNAILVEMDGFDSLDQVIVVASTNRADVLDPALTRPGRFDRQVHVSLPDIKGRVEILKVHSKKVKMAPGVDLEKLARGTPMFSGADLEAIINEAAINATMATKDFIEQADLEEARDKVRWGRARKSHKIEEDEKRVIAYHEAGHAVVTYCDSDSEPLHKVTIIPRGPALGVTFMLPEKDKHIYSKKQLLAMMRVSYGGRISEEMFTGDQYNGTGGDIRMATNIARAMVTEYGMSDRVGFVYRGDEEGRQPWDSSDSMSDQTARIIDEEIKAVIDQTFSETTQLLEKHRQQVEDLAQALLQYETLNAEEVEKIMKGQPLDKATVSDLLEAEKSKVEVSQPKPISTPVSDLDDDTPSAMPSPA